jgi:hypothetical protein
MLDEVTSKPVSMRSRRGHLLVTEQNYPTARSYRMAIGVAAGELIKFTFAAPFVLTTRRVTLIAAPADTAVVLTSYVAADLTVTTPATEPVRVHNRDMVNGAFTTTLVFRGGAAEVDDDNFLDEGIITSNRPEDNLMSPRELPAGDYYIIISGEEGASALLAMEWEELTSV